MNILVVGEESAGIRTLQALARTDHRIVAVMASRDTTMPGSATMWQVAQHLGLPIWDAKLVKDASFAERIRESAVDILLNVHSLFIINDEVLSAPRIGSFNLHPGPLPRYAGLNAPSWAIFRGETSHGVTVHKMERGIDTGAIVYQSRFDIGENDTALTVSTRCIKDGVATMLRLVETASADPSAIPLVPQDLSQREYFKPGPPTIDGLFRSLPARQVVNFVRACDYHPLPSPWGSPRVKLGDRTMSVIKATLTGTRADSSPGAVGRVDGAGAQVACSDEWVTVAKVIVEGRYRDAADVLRTGDQLEDIGAG